MAKYCTNCGKELDDKADLCLNCGVLVVNKTNSNNKCNKLLYICNNGIILRNSRCS